MKKFRFFALVLAVMLLAGCASSENAVYVQSVASLSGMGGIAPGDRFAGLVVAENVTEIFKDEDKAVHTLFVKEGEDVQAGQELFSYDTDQLQLSLDRKNLELEQLKATIENYKQQIIDLEAERNRSSDKLEYTVQIQTTQLDLKEAELNLAAKQTEVEQAKTLLENASVVSPIAGRIQSISENGTDNYGNPTAYITIRQAGSYRVKGTIGELQRGALMEGSRVQILSRTDDSVWTGTISLIDYENPQQGNQYDMYYGMESDEMTSSSKYPFYVELESIDGLMLGQHVYIQPEISGESQGLAISDAFIAYDDNGSPYVWKESRGKLKMQSVALGEYDMMMGTVQILEGLTESDYIAFPDPELCREGAPVSREAVAEDAVAEEGAG
ncbi:MAG: efflux RND transporter periplasmic adaptor subunit [Oscillospiraceae bacterium]|nr:efflux RND transporter periplasmic adaptor subunit [Oscillospiraceae bacterium]